MKEPYEITGKKQRVWIFGLIILLIMIGLVYVLVQFG